MSGRQTVAMGALALVFALAGALTWRWYSGDWPASRGAQSGQLLLSTTLPDLDGRPQAFAQWRGKVLVVNFWATWCDPCREEIPGLITLQQAYTTRGVQLVGIAIDQKQRAALYAKDVGMNYPVLLGGIETMNLAERLGNRAGVLPYTVIIDSGGRTVRQSVGIMKLETLESVIKPLISVAKN